MRTLLAILFSKKFFGFEIAVFLIAVTACMDHPKHLFLIAFYTLFGLVFSRLVKTYFAEKA